MSVCVLRVRDVLFFSALTIPLSAKVFDQSSLTLTTSNSQKLADSVLLMSIVWVKGGPPIVYAKTPKSESVQISSSQGSAIVISSKYELVGSVLTVGKVKLRTIL